MLGIAHDGLARRLLKNLDVVEGFRRRHLRRLLTPAMRGEA
jgi:hypothetical protein